MSRKSPLERNFTECFGSKVFSTRNFILFDSNFTGSFFVTSGSALEVTETLAIITDCAFCYGTPRTTVSSKRNDIGQFEVVEKKIGGALISNQSSVTLVRCNFTSNRAQFGGAIYAENGSILVINETNFIFNAANASFLSIPYETSAGGVLYAVNNCSVYVYKSLFDKNSVYHGYRLGGAIAIHRGSIEISDCRFTSNRAEKGGIKCCFS